MEYEPCLPVISILSSRAHHLGDTIPRLTDRWTDFKLIAPPHVFDETHYYEEEMDYPLLRWWGYRDRLADPSDLVGWKSTCSDIEDQLRSGDGDRTVNIDPGYLNYGLVVLASNKYDLQKIYLGDGVYADPVLQYGDGQFQSFPWSFPDFKDDEYYATLETFREYYRRLRQDSPE
jgi:hypothetical protein